MNTKVQTYTANSSISMTKVQIIIRRDISRNRTSTSALVSFLVSSFAAKINKSDIAL